MEAKLLARNLLHEVTSSVAQAQHGIYSREWCIELAVSVIPREEFGFMLHKGTFRDAVALRYGRLPSLSLLFLQHAYVMPALQ